MSTYHVLNAVWVGVLPMFVASLLIAVACYIVCCLNRIKNRCKQHRKHKAAKKAKKKFLLEQRQQQREQQQIEKSKRSLMDLAVESGSIPSTALNSHRGPEQPTSSRTDFNSFTERVSSPRIENERQASSSFEKTHPPPPTYAQLRSSLTLNLNEGRNKGSPRVDGKPGRLHSTNSHDNLVKFKPMDRRVLYKSSGNLNRQSSMNAGDFYVKFDASEPLEPMVVQELNESPKSSYSRMQTLTRSVQQQRKLTAHFEKNPHYFSSSDKHISKTSVQKVSSPVSGIPTQIFQVQQTQQKKASITKNEQMSEKRKETVKINESVELVNGAYESSVLIVKQNTTTSVTETNEVKTSSSRQSSDSSASRQKKTYKRHERNVRHDEFDNGNANESTTSFSFNEEGVGADDEDTSLNEMSSPTNRVNPADKSAKKSSKGRPSDKKSSSAKNSIEYSVLNETTSSKYPLPLKGRLVKKQPSKLALSNSNKVNSDIDLEEDLIFNDDDNDSLSSADMLPKTLQNRKSSLNSLNFKRRKNEPVYDQVTKKSPPQKSKKPTGDEDNGPIKYLDDDDVFDKDKSRARMNIQLEPNESAFHTDSTLQKLPTPPSPLLNDKWNHSTPENGSKVTSPTKTVNFSPNVIKLANASSLSDIDPDENILKNLLVKTSKQQANGIDDEVS